MLAFVIALNVALYGREVAIVAPVVVVSTGAALVIARKARDKAIERSKPEDALATYVAYLQLKPLGLPNVFGTWAKALTRMPAVSRVRRAYAIEGFVDFTPSEIRWRPAARVAKRYGVTPLVCPLSLVDAAEVRSAFPRLEFLSPAVLILALRGGHVELGVRNPREIRERLRALYGKGF